MKNVCKRISLKHRKGSTHITIIGDTSFLICKLKKADHSEIKCLFHSLLAEENNRNVISNRSAHSNFSQIYKGKILCLVGKQSNIWSTRFSRSWWLAWTLPVHDGTLRHKEIVLKGKPVPKACRFYRFLYKENMFYNKCTNHQ